MIYRILFISLFLIYGVLVSSGQGELMKKLKPILESSTFDYASVGLSVRSMDGKEVVQFNSDKKLIPASSLKLITTLQAIEELGEDFKFQTRIGYSGQIDRAGTLNGNIVIIGSGDPSLGSRRFGKENEWNVVLAKIVKAIQDAGIKCIEGKIEVKTNVFKGQAICPSWPYSDIANYYASGAWGVNFNENKYDLAFSPKVKEGEIATLEYIKPEIPNMHLSSEVIIKGPKTGDNAYIYGDPFHYSKIVRGSIPYSEQPFVIKGATPNPPLSLAYMIELEVSKLGIKCNGSMVSNDAIKKSEFTQFASFKSPALSQIVKQANYESINLYCEVLLKMLGRKMKEEGSFDGGLDYISEALQEMEIPKSSYSIKDGSGLSPRNSITASSFSQYLTTKINDLGIKKLQKYIPHVGVSGTVKSLMQGKKRRKNFYLKSGSMGEVLSYTGIFKGKSGKEYSVCFISNDHAKGNRSVRVEAEKVFELLFLNL
ncbi:MAG: D-alanyl-D-alanine carboxypeptidase/D-alanyl-D-alanine-endopeptidase [Saprospiraceae bacterium]|nr:D-alanyl-D-alanine carboxypeptidase/D-alanyl-D-alanine-endopeptidase [Saprospiraceae bacterium]